MHPWKRLGIFSILCATTTTTKSMTSRTSAFAASPAANDHGGPPSSSHEADTPLALPEADPNTNIPRIKLGETIRFEELGPIILNTDGTTRRIENWDQMTEQEQQVTWRRISLRNEERRQKLLEQGNSQSNPREEQKEQKDL